jgi:hypothetical protein
MSQGKGFSKSKWLKQFIPKFKEQNPRAYDNYEKELVTAQNTYDDRYWDDDQEYKQWSQQHVNIDKAQKQVIDDLDRYTHISNLLLYKFLKPQINSQLRKDYWLKLVNDKHQRILNPRLQQPQRI